MRLSSWMYVSHSHLSIAEAKAELPFIVATSRGRNQSLDVTGALLFTGRHFAQLIEGPGSSVTALRDRISLDSRHADLTTLGEEAIASRRFADWALAYAGPSPLVGKIVERAMIDSAGSEDAGVTVLRLLSKFSPLQ